MRILTLSNLYPPDFIGGYELCCRQMVEGLLGRRHEVEVLTTAPRVPCPSEPLVRRSFKLANCYDPYSLLRNAPATRAIASAEANLVSAYNVHVLTSTLADFEPDVVYLWNLVGLGGLGLLGCLQYLGVPWVWCLEDSTPHTLCALCDEVLPGLAREYNRYVRGHYHAVSERVIEEIAAGGVDLRGDVEILPNWVLGRRPSPRTRYYRRGDTLRIVSAAGHLERHKGIDLLIRAAALLCDRGYRNFSVDLYGKVTDLYVSCLPARNGVEHFVNFRGPCSQQELFGRYARQEYDLFAFPTWEREPFGCAPMEAAAYGCVMAVSQSCGVGEWFVDGIHCLKTARRVDAWADLFEQVLDGAIDLAPLGRRASDVIWRDFHIDALLPRVERLLQRASGAPRTRLGTASEAYRLALLAEKLTQALVQEEPVHAAA